MKQLSSIHSRLWRWLSLRLGISFIVFVALVAVFVALADEVREQETLAIDQWILQAVHGFENSFLDHTVPIFTEVGGAIGVTLLSAIILGVLLIKKRRNDAILVSAGVAGAVAINFVLKSFFGRTRPDLWERLVHEASYSFPSGHAMASATLGLTVVLVLWRTKWRWWSVAIATCYIVFVGLTRLYLGVHYPTDILAGWVVSAAWLMFVHMALHEWGLFRKS